MSSISTIFTALSSLVANQQALEVTGQNVANVNTPGYHRREAIMRERTNGIAGTLMTPRNSVTASGVDVVSVRRLQNIYLEQQGAAAEGQVGRWSIAQDRLQQLETVLAPGSEIDLSSRLTQFFGAWQQLATHPEEAANRLQLASAATTLTERLRQTAGQLTAMGTQLDADVADRLSRVNELADTLATLNTNIVASTDPNGSAALLDQRDQVLGELATLTGATSVVTARGVALVNLGGRALVQGGTASHLAMTQGASGTAVTWADGATADIRQGEIGGVLEVRNTVLPTYQRQLDDLAYGLATAINRLHRTGVTGTGAPAGDFFSGTSASTLRVAEAIQADSRMIASTTQANAPGDGSLAQQIFALARSPLVGTQTAQDVAHGMLSQIGTQVRAAGTMLDTQTAVRDQVAAQAQAVSGVSLDEELTNMLVYQRAYDAAARVLTTADQLIQTLLERLG